MKESEYRDLVAKANAGDGQAAATLAFFEDMRDDKTREGGRKWWVLAAERGDCRALRHMLNDAIQQGRRAAADKWRTRIRWNKCASSSLGEEVNSDGKK